VTSLPRVIVTVSLDGGQEEETSVIVQTNVFAPKDNPVTPDVGLAGDVTDALPAMTVQSPVPTVGVFPASVVAEPQTPKSGPALAVVGDSSLVMFTVSLVVVQTPLLIIHSNEFSPTLSPVTPEAGSPGVVTDAPPAIVVHVPVPTAGVFPASVVVAEQTV
jgi:hypothetical protein